MDGAAAVAAVAGTTPPPKNSVPVQLLNNTNDPNNNNNSRVLSMAPGAASLLSKFVPFDKQAYAALKIRIQERERLDNEMRRRLQEDDHRLVDGDLVGVNAEDEELKEDPKLAEGKSLPKIVAQYFPKKFLGTPIEDIDPRNREYEETFVIINRRFNKRGYIHRFSATPSMFIFWPWNPIRRLALYAYTHPVFDIIVIFTILANSLSMAMNIADSVPEYTFLAIYTLEAIVKAIARGLFLEKHTYLREGWNWLDFGVLISAYTTIIVQAVSSGTAVNIQALRTFRVFRVLKTIAIIPGLKSIIEALIRSLKMLSDVLIMTIFFFTIFALFGLMLFQGTMLTKCVQDANFAGVNLSNDSTYTDSSGVTYPSWQDWTSNSSNWFMQDNGWEYMVCSNVSNAQSCPKNYSCILVKDSPNPNNDFTKFDNFYSSFMISVQIFNTDYWDFLYHGALAGNGPAAFLYFLLAIVFLAYYLSNLVQAVVALSYEVDGEEDDNEMDDVTVQRKETKRRFVFDPWKLRMIRRGPDARTSSLLSVRNVTERKFGHHNGTHIEINGGVGVVETGGAASTSSSTHAIPNATSKPVAVVKPQQSPAAEHHPRPSSALPRTSTTTPGQDGPRFQVASRPPSALSAAKLPLVGFWDRNPICCLHCCHRSMTFFGWLKFQHYLLIVVTDPFFELFITLTIILNTISMAAAYNHMPQSMADALGAINDVCTYIFITEAVLKLTAMSKEYFVNRWNWLDFIVVLGSILDIVISNVNFSMGGFNSSIIRLFRLLRILKLAQSWKTMRLLLEIILGTMSAIANLMLVLLIVIFIFAVIGMQLFGGTYTDAVFRKSPTFSPFPGFTGIPEWNWDDFLHAFMHVFRLLCRETYQPMFDCISANSAAICVPFYMCTLIVASYVVLNLFLAVLLNAFNSDSLHKLTQDAEETRLRRRIKKIKRFIKSTWLSVLYRCCPNLIKQNATVAPVNMDSTSASGFDADNTTTIAPAEEQDRDQEMGRESPTEDTKTRRASQVVENVEVKNSDVGSITTDTGKSTGSREHAKMRKCCWPIIDRKMPWLTAPFNRETRFGQIFWRARQFCFNLCNNKAFEYTILVFIFISSISLCFQDSTLQDGSLEDQILSYVDYVCLGVFTIELLIKMFAYGVRVYFTSFWTLLDFFIVTTAYIDIGMSMTSSSVNLSSLKALRTLRALRPLRAISQWQGMKIVINALITAIPGIGNVLLVVLLIWLIFAIMGVQFFSGKFYMCVEVASGNRIPRALAPNKTVCLNNTDWAWANALINYDNVAYAYLALFQMATFEGWLNIFYCSVDSPESFDSQPAPEININYYVYYVIFIVFCSFFLLNLFVGVIIDDFNALKKKYEGGTAMMLFMTDSQKKYYSTIKQLGAKKPRKAIVKPTNPFSRFMYDIANSQRFDFCIALVIAANLVVMATEHYGQSQVFSTTQDMFNLVFTTIFTLEAAVKIIGLRQYYFRIPWNVFDFVLVLISLLSIGVADLLAAQHVSPSLLRLLRVLRIGRVVRLFRTSKGVRRLLFSFIMSLPALFNIACLLFLIIFIYAIIGMNLFGHVGHFGGNLDDVANFHTFTYALLTLFRLTTVSGWDNVHQGLSFSDDPATGCNPNQDILDPRYPQSNPCCNHTAWVRPNGDLVIEPNGPGNCGNFSLATIYLVSYLLLTFFIIVNMFAAVILDSYQQASQQEDLGVTDDDIEAFYHVWQDFDPKATQFIKFKSLSEFLAALEPPLGVAKPNEHAITLLDFPILKDKNTGDEVIHCLDVLMGVVRKALGFIEETEDFIQVKENLEMIFRTAFPNRVQVQKVSSTKQRKKEDVAARVIQKNWRNAKASGWIHEYSIRRKQGSSPSGNVRTSTTIALPRAAGGQIIITLPWGTSKRT